MSKYSLEEIHKSNVKEAMSADDQARFDQLTKDDQLKLEKIFAMMKAEKDAKKSTNEDFDSVVDKIKDSGKSEEDAKKIAGAINAKYVGNYREGVEENGQVDDYTEEIAEENDEDKLPMDEARVDRDVAERIEGMLSIPLKRKFLDSFMDLWQDLIEEDPFYAEDVINHLNNEMHKEIDGYQAMGDRLAGMEENHAMQGVEAELESGEIGNMDALTEEISEKDIIKALKAANAQDFEIEVYMKSLKQAGDKFDEVDDYVEDFMNYVDDKALQEHFGRFLKDYQ
jgi:hypothetical protein